ncbi:ElyC/SanA/YdcF family protein [Shigella flexneri]
MKVFAYSTRIRDQKKLIFTGGVAKTNTVSTAEVGAELRNRWACRASRIITLDLPKDTKEEAAAVEQAIGDAPSCW